MIQSAAFADARAASVQQVQARAENVRNQQASTSKVSVSSTGGSSLTLKATTNRDEGVRVRAIRVGGDRWGLGRTTTKTWEPGGDPFVTKRTTQWAWAAGRLGKASGSRESATKEVAHGGVTGSAFLQTSQSQSSKTTLSKQTITKTSEKTSCVRLDHGRGPAIGRSDTNAPWLPAPLTSFIVISVHSFASLVHEGV